MPTDAELRFVWTSPYGVNWNVYLYSEVDYKRWSVRQDRQSPDEIAFADVLPKKDMHGNSVNLVYIWVNPPYRRQRLARAILDDLIAWCRKQNYTRVFGSIRNESDANYKGLKSIYEDSGFEVLFDEETSRDRGTMNASILQILGNQV